MTAACWVCGVVGNPMADAIGGARCADRKPCEARQPAYLAAIYAALRIKNEGNMTKPTETEEHTCHWCRDAQPLDEDGYCADEKACVDRVRAKWLAENARVAS